MRRAVLPALVMVVGLLSACSLVWEPAATPPTPTATAATVAGTATATATPLRPPPAPQPPPFGVSVRGEIYDAGVQRLVKEAGVRWVRTSVRWADVERSKGQYTWDVVDNHLLMLSRLGLVPLVYVSHNPPWAASSLCGPIDKVPLADFARFVATLAGRYNGTTVVQGQVLPAVHYWQFYNEPDNRWTTGEASDFDGCWGEAPEAYARMLDAVWAAVHGANPEAKVVFGGVAAEYVDCPASWSCAGQRLYNFRQEGGDFLEGVFSYMREHPSTPYFDIFDFHYYPAFHRAWDGYAPGLRGKVSYFRQRLADAGIVRPIMCSEVGRRSDPAQVIDGVPGSDADQSRYVARLFAQGMAEGLVSLLWFNLTDIVEPAQGGAAAWGLLDSRLQAKPAYRAYQVTAQELAALTYTGVAKAPPGVEAYAFRGGGREVLIAWSNTGAAALTVPGEAVTVRDVYGNPTAVTDGGTGDSDGRTNGQVVILLSRDPVWIRQDVR